MATTFVNQLFEISNLQLASDSPSDNGFDEACLLTGWCAFSRQGFGRQSNRANGTGNNNQQRVNGMPNSSPTSVSPNGPLPSSGSSYNLAPGSMQQIGNSQPESPEPPKHFFQERYARLGVKGNFMPLAAQPTNVDLGEWLAHQSVEHYRVVENLISCIQEVDANTGQAICNPKSCPVMSAGRSHTYTWLNQNKEPIKVPAATYIGLVQKWIRGKITDPKVFPINHPTGSTSNLSSTNLNTPSTPEANIPTSLGSNTLNTPGQALAGRDWVGKAAGFPESFLNDCKTIIRQLFRVYAHIYHSHWVEPFWHLTDSSSAHGWTDLNSCFVHFITVAKLFGLLTEKDTEPMQPLIDIWIANGAIPADAAAGACTIIP